MDKNITPEKKNSGVRKLSISVEQWHQLALEGINTAVSLKLDGESMRPLIRKQKDTVTVFPVTRKLKKGDIVLFARNDGVYVVHRIRKINGNKILTIGDSCAEFDFPISERSVWGLAVRLERNGKTYNLDSSVSRFYGILIMYIRPIRFIWRKLLKFGVKIIRRTEGKNE